MSLRESQWPPQIRDLRESCCAELRALSERQTGHQQVFPSDISGNSTAMSFARHRMPAPSRFLHLAATVFCEVMNSAFSIRRFVHHIRNVRANFILAPL